MDHMTPPPFLPSTFRIGAAAGILLATPAFAELPAPVKAMVDSAVETGDTQKVETVIEIAKKTNPDQVAELDAILSDVRAERARLANEEARKKEEQIRHAGVFERWSGRGQVGASLSSGNSDNAGVSVALSLERTGIDWQHRLRMTADYQRSNGVTSTEKYLAAYEPRYQINRRLFTYALAQYERDKFQGFSSRYSVSGGLGYKVLDNKALQMSVQVGPSWRHVDFTDGTQGSSLGVLAGLDFDWQLAKNLKFTQNANLVADGGTSASVIIDSNSTTVALTSGLEAKISDHFTTRFSYTIDYNSNPAEGAVSTDTLTRITLVYGF